jgi:RHS repeat-associated protein
MSDGAGAVSEGPITYDAFGNSASTGGVPFKYTGRRYDAETGLYYYRARYYSPALGRFMQTDPIGDCDDFNLYAYVDNDPTNKTDPTGLSDLAETWGSRRRGCEGSTADSCTAGGVPRENRMRGSSTGSTYYDWGPSEFFKLGVLMGNRGGGGEGGESEAETPPYCGTGQDVLSGCTEKVTVTAKRLPRRQDAPLHVQFFVGLTEIPAFLGDLYGLGEQIYNDPDKAKRCSGRCSLVADAEKKFNPLNKIPKYAAQFAFYKFMEYLGEALVGQYAVWGYNGIEAGKFTGEKAACMSNCMNDPGG